MKIICDVCCNKADVVKNTYCRVCGNNLSEQFFNEELQKSKEKIAYEKEKMQLINYCLSESENCISQSIIANRYHYIKNKYNKIEYRKV
ncbi:MAG: hypothetical protein IJY90_01750 [Clostridia bacterium]|nr:hypothetical protein [Clostridia bacterium]